MSAPRFRRFFRRVLAATLVAGLAGAVAPAQAGRPCEEQPLQAQAVTQGMGLALRTAQALDASGAQVLLLARAGQDLSSYGLRWSHMAFVYRVAPAAGAAAPGAPAPSAPAEPPATQPLPRASGMVRTAYVQVQAPATPAAPAADVPARLGTWRVVHKLNHCGSADAAVYRQGLGEFFMDRPYRYEAVFIALPAELQARLLPLLQDNTAMGLLDEPRYNMLAYPWAQTYQQSNQWVIETLAMAAEPSITSRVQAQAWLQFKGYQPTVLRLGPLTRLGARATRANVAFDDHPNDKRFADRIETVTVDSVLQWLLRAGLAGGRTVQVR